MPGTSTVEIIVHDEVLILSALRALYWPAQRQLILADMHLGKTGHFRTHGIPVSPHVVYDDLARLSALIKTFCPEQVLVVGDMFHHKFNKELLVFKEWRQQFRSVDFLLIPGNHDRHPGIDYADLSIDVAAERYIINDLLFIHEMKESVPDKFTVSGHLHPGYLVKGRARQALYLPCFISAPEFLILPAFSAFTGLYAGYPQGAGNNYFVISQGKLFRF